MLFTNSLYRPNPSGRLGSSVFSKNKAGLYEKMFVKPTNPRSTYQVLLRILFASLTRAWASLTSAQRQGWNNLQSFFPKKTGFNVFVGLNRNLQDIGEAILDDAPNPEDLLYPPSPTTFSAAIVTTPGSEDITLTISPAIDANTKVKVFATALLKPSRKVDYKQLTLIGTIDNTFVSGGSIMSMYLAKFGVMPATGSLAAFGIEPVAKATGLANIRQETSAIGAV